MSTFLSLVFTFWSLSIVYADPQLLGLNRFSSLAKYSVKDVEAGAMLFVASSDDNIYLKNIRITSGASTTTLDRLNDFNDDGSPKSFQIEGDLVVSTTNDDSITQSLTGSIYFTTRLQALDPNFSVFVVKDSQTFSRAAMKSTIVILNTNLLQNHTNLEPRKVSYVTEINQSPNTNIYFHWGIPSANWNDVTNNTFFRNAITLENGTDSQRVFFDHVEPLQVALDCWYITVMGPVNMRIASKYVSDLSYTTTAVNTTGIVVNEHIYQNHVVNFTPDQTRTGVSGAFYSAFINQNSELKIQLEAGTGIVSTNVNRTNEGRSSFYTSAQATRLMLNTTTLNPGAIYVQYFTLSGGLFPATQVSTISIDPTTTTGQNDASVSTTPVVTTTRGSSVEFSVQSIFVILCAIILY